MKFGKKELVIIIPLIAIAVLITYSVLFTREEPQIVFSTECQEGWFKYETQAGVICAKTELSQEQLDGFGK